jgi:dTDP-4-amino-4,6-dideoxygalactose transaminase
MAASVHSPRPQIDAARTPIRFQHPELPPIDEIAAHFRRAQESGWYSNGGPCATELSERLSARLGAHGVLVANATLGIMAALRAGTIRITEGEPGWGSLP